MRIYYDINGEPLKDQSEPKDNGSHLWEKNKSCRICGCCLDNYGMCTNCDK